MKTHAARAFLLTLLSLGLAAAPAGCGGDAKDGPSKKKENETPTGIERIRLDALPPLADPLPPLEGGTIEIAPPEGWNIARRSGLIAVFFENNSVPLPRMDVSVKDAPDAPMATAGEKNIEKLAEHLAAGLNERSVAEPPRAILLGDRAAVRYVKHTKFQGTAAQSLIVAALRQGKLYEFTLHVFDGQLDKKGLDGYTPRQEAYAVVAGTKFLAGAEATDATAEGG